VEGSPWRAPLVSALVGQANKSSDVNTQLYELPTRPVQCCCQRWAPIKRLKAHQLPLPFVTAHHIPEFDRRKARGDRRLRELLERLGGTNPTRNLPTTLFLQSNSLRTYDRPVNWLVPRGQRLESNTLESPRGCAGHLNRRESLVPVASPLLGSIEPGLAVDHRWLSLLHCSA
jgi:hypothetical protein